MTDPQVNVEGPQPGDRVQVEARGKVLSAFDRNGVTWAGVEVQADGRRARVWLPVDMLVLLAPRAMP